MKKNKIVVGVVSDETGHYGYIKVFSDGYFVWSKKSEICRITEQDAYEDGWILKKEVA